jgi:hypothetical protein
VWTELSPFLSVLPKDQKDLCLSRLHSVVSWYNKAIFEPGVAFCFGCLEVYLRVGCEAIHIGSKELTHWRARSVVILWRE